MLKWAGDRVLEQREDKMGPGTSLRSYDSKELSDFTGVDTGDESLVQQQFVNDADVNEIVRRFGLVRTLPVAVQAGVYGDFTGIHDYQSALDMIGRAQDRFMDLPAQVRERFDNDPGKMIAYAQSVSEEDFEAAFRVEQPAGGVVPPVDSSS